MSGSWRSIPYRARSSSSFSIEPLWMPTTAPWRMGWLFAVDLGMALRVVADVDERLRCVLRDRDLVEERARAAAELRDGDGSVGSAGRIPDGVGAALGDPGEERLRRERPTDRRVGAQAVSGYAAHDAIPLSRSDDISHRRRRGGGVCLGSG